MNLVTLILMLPALMAVYAFCDLIQRQRATVRDGWRYLTPGPMFWLGLLSGVVLTAVFTLVSVSNQSTAFLKTLAGFFNLLTIATILITMREEVRWNATHLERRTVTGRIRRIAWSELSRLGYEASGYHWVSGFEGPRIRFQSYSHGFTELMQVVRHHLPRDGPPPETAPALTARETAHP